MRTLKLSVCIHCMQWPSAICYSPLPTLAKPTYSRRTEEHEVPWNVGEWWSSVSINSHHVQLLPRRCQSLVCRTFLCCWWPKLLGDLVRVLSRRCRYWRERCCLAADPGWWRVRLQTGEMVRTRVHQEPGICEIRLLPLKTHILLWATACSSLRSPGCESSLGCWWWP